MKKIKIWHIALTILVLVLLLPVFFLIVAVAALGLLLGLLFAWIRHRKMIKAMEQLAEDMEAAFQDPTVVDAEGAEVTWIGLPESDLDE